MSKRPYEIALTEESDRQLRALSARDRRILEAAILARLQPAEDDSLTDELLASNPKVQQLVAKSKASPPQAVPNRG